MLTIGAREPLWCTEKRRDAQQRIYADEEHGLRRDRAQRKLRINSQDALQTARNRITQSRGNVEASNITLLEGINVETEKSTYSKTNNVETFSEQSVVNQRDTDRSTKVDFFQTSPVTVINTKETESVNVNTMDDREKNSPTNTSKTPQRPQDLIDNGSALGMATVNAKSSAQYRKSYAFKIWREKGCFPYRLADQTTTDNRKKSKKHINAMKAQQDRQNEEAWRAFKNLKATNLPKNAQPPTQRGSEIMNTVSGINEQLPHNLHKAFPIPQEGMTAMIRNTSAHQNSIPDYFKTKKDASSKSQTVPVCKSIPTSVISINSAKSYETPQPFSEADDEMTQVATELHNSRNSKGVPKESSAYLSLTLSPKNILSTGEASIRVPASHLVQWSREETSIKEIVQQPHVLGTILAKTPEETGVSMLPNFGRHNNDSLTWSECDASPAADMQRQHQGQEICPSNNTPYKSPVSLTTTPSRLTDQRKQDDKSIENARSCNADGNPTTNHEKQLAGVMPLQTDCDTVPRELIPERDGHLSPLPTSSVVAIVKSTLSKKYCKENVKPDSGSVGVRGRKRRFESTNDEGAERQRGRSKQGKHTVFTRLNESVAMNLADGIHNVNSEYFPIDALANKAAKETSEYISAIQSRPPSKTSIKNKVEEIDRARLLLKELFDVTSESDQDREMQTFDVASRSFGRKNILNHLSLLDRYFAEFQKKLTSEVSSTPTTNSGLI